MTHALLPVQSLYVERVLSFTPLRRASQTLAYVVHLRSQATLGDIMWVPVLWVVFAVLVGVFAANKGRNGFLGFLLAIVLSPLVGFIWVAVLRDKRIEARHDELVSALSKPAPNDTRACPRCAETIKRAATVCRFCQSELTAAA